VRAARPPGYDRSATGQIVVSSCLFKRASELLLVSVHGPSLIIAERCAACRVEGHRSAGRYTLPRTGSRDERRSTPECGPPRQCEDGGGHERESEENRQQSRAEAWTTDDLLPRLSVAGPAVSGRNGTASRVPILRGNCVCGPGVLHSSRLSARQARHRASAAAITRRSRGRFRVETESVRSGAHRALPHTPIR
jgi:hypothetical protein